MKKAAKTIVAIVLILVFFVPIPTRYKDGGSVRYRAILYDVTKYHQLDLESETGYRDGWDIKIAGIPVYNNFD